jgi:peptidoglycan L-alanyl-D-glutamate endopeptidase CwlK
MSFCFSKRSLSNLEGVHPDLVKVCARAGELCCAAGVDFILTDGCRTIEEQKEYVKTGKSKTMRSRHLGGFAVDYVALVNHKVTYDHGPMAKIAECFKMAAQELDIPIEWGGDWVNFKDTPHIQLKASIYPDRTTQVA